MLSHGFPVIVMHLLLLIEPSNLLLKDVRYTFAALAVYMYIHIPYAISIGGMIYGLRLLDYTKPIAFLILPVVFLVFYLSHWYTTFISRCQKCKINKRIQDS